MNESRSPRKSEYYPPPHGEFGGPLTCVIAKYEDGTKIIYGHERVEEWAKSGSRDGSTGDSREDGLGSKNAGEEYRIIYKNNKPYGIRDSGGFLFFFTKITKYTDQEERDRKEVEEQYRLADYLLKTLKECGEAFFDV